LPWNRCKIRVDAVSSAATGKAKSARRTLNQNRNTHRKRYLLREMRWSSASKEKPAALGTASSPSRANLAGRSTRRDHFRKVTRQRLAGLRLDLDVGAVPQDEAAETIPLSSHLGSYCQPFPVGMRSTESASIDAIGWRNAKVMTF
jgi:hypothetical protein